MNRKCVGQRSEKKCEAHDVTEDIALHRATYYNIFHSSFCQQLDSGSLVKLSYGKPYKELRKFDVEAYGHCQGKLINETVVMKRW